MGKVISDSFKHLDSISRGKALEGRARSVSDGAKNQLPSPPPETVKDQREDMRKKRAEESKKARLEDMKSYG